MKQDGARWNGSQRSRGIGHKSCGAPQMASVWTNSSSSSEWSKNEKKNHNFVRAYFWDVLDKKCANIFSIVFFCLGPRSSGYSIQNFGRKAEKIVPSETPYFDLKRPNRFFGRFFSIFDYFVKLQKILEISYLVHRLCFAPRLQKSNKKHIFQNKIQ